jgi:hypothetical protein
LSSVRERLEIIAQLFEARPPVAVWKDAADASEDARSYLSGGLSQDVASASDTVRRSIEDSARYSIMGEIRHSIIANERYVFQGLSQLIQTSARQDSALLALSFISGEGPEYLCHRLRTLMMDVHQLTRYYVQYGEFPNNYYRR